MYDKMNISSTCRNRELCHALKSCKELRLIVRTVYYGTRPDIHLCISGLVIISCYFTRTTRYLLVDQKS